MTVYKKLKVNLACPRHKEMKGNRSIAPPILSLCIVRRCALPRERTPALIEKESGWTIRVIFGIMCAKCSWN
jgi:hypothetical protein